MRVVLWLTGLSGSGKTTIAEALKKKYELKNRTVCILDGDVVRSTNSRKLGFSREDIGENNRRVALLAKKRKEKYDLTLIPVIAPFAEYRKTSKKIIGDSFFEVFVDCSVRKCMKRDIKGLYREAALGKRDKLIGMRGSLIPYEVPDSPDIHIKTGDLSIKESIAHISDFLEENGF